MSVVNTDIDKPGEFVRYQGMRLGVRNLKGFAEFKKKDGDRAKQEMLGEVPAKKSHIA